MSMDHGETKMKDMVLKKKVSMNHHTMDHDTMKMKTTASRHTGSERSLSPYKKLRSIRKSTLPNENPKREIVLNLTEDMERYVWSIDGEIISEENSIKIRHGENVRFVLINKTMMHHPMHLHGHFFRVINGQGDYSPLKHTIDVPPHQLRS